MRYLQLVKMRNGCSNVAQQTCIVFAPSTHQLLFDMQIGDLTPHEHRAKLLPYDRQLVLICTGKQTGEKFNLFYM